MRRNDEDSPGSDPEVEHGGGEADNALGEEDLEFELEPDELGDERSAVLRDAARDLDAYYGQLADGDGDGAPESDLAREFERDEAALSPPQLLRLDLTKLSIDAPVRKTELLKRWRFYWMVFPVSLWTRPGRGFNRLEFKATFNHDDDEQRRPRTHDALPTQQFADLAKAHGSLNIGVGGHLKVAFTPPSVDLNAAGVPLAVDAGVQTEDKLDAGFVLGPLEYSLRVPRVMRSNLELDKVLWRLEGSRMVQENDPGLRVVLKVPNDIGHLYVSAAVRARRYVKTFDGTLVDAMGSVSTKVAYFFRRGAPIGQKQSWELTDQL